MGLHVSRLVSGQFHGLLINMHLISTFLGKATKGKEISLISTAQKTSFISSFLLSRVVKRLGIPHLSYASRRHGL